MGSSSIDKSKSRISGGGLIFFALSALFFIAWLRSLFSSPFLYTSSTDADVRNEVNMSLEAMQKAAAVLDSELMLSAPPSKTYDDRYINPCWKSEAGILRCLPYAYISGFQTGARALSRSLAAHPSVAFDIGAAYGPWPTSQQQQGYSKGYWNEYRNQLQSYLGHIMGHSSVREKLDISPRETIVREPSSS